MDEEIFHLPCTDPQFLARVYLQLLEENKENPLVRLFDLPSEVPHEDFRFRALNRARRLALVLMDEKGELKKDFPHFVLSLLEKGGPLFYPQGLCDSLIHDHIVSFLRTLQTDAVQKSLKRFQRPLCHRWAEKLVLETLGTNGPITEAHIRAAVLCACLTPLRQNVGSCFATAPAILVQRDQVLLFLDDLYQLLSTGKLKRTFGGVEYAVPLSPSAGRGGVGDNPLLKAWEYTLASFSEVKMEFSRWNLYSSLGLAPEEPGGIGAVIYKALDDKIHEMNKKIEECQKQYEIAFDQARATESLLRNAGSESDARRLQAEYQSRAYHMRACLEMRDAAYEKGSHYSSLFSYLAGQYDKKFPDYFQEIYDAEMQGFQADIYDDSPAGFRLVYKHGRPDPSAWTLVYDEGQYVDALVQFFSATENEISATCEWEECRPEIGQITSSIIAHLRTREFMDTALKRMTKAHGSAPDKKPWAYTSGGTMTTLLKTYYAREADYTVEERWVESESELLIFLIDTLKNLPPRVTAPYLKDPRKAMLMTSPSHAFLLHPAGERFREGWQEEIFTYTWVRDTVFLPSQRFYSTMRLSPAEQTFLLEKFSNSLPGSLFSEERKISIADWRKRILDAVHGPKQALADSLDAFLYQSLPVVQGQEWKVLVRRILSDLMDDKVEQTLKLFPDVPCPFLTAREVREAAKGCYLLAQRKIAYPVDMHEWVAQHARFVGLAQPTPVLFGDTNWTDNFFGFVVNPGTGRLELWRLDKTLSQGAPMSSWKHWLNGADRSTWSVFTRPHEYSSI